ncbi:MAG: ATP-binding cassette domain-containing protein [Desulfurococcaceae archaeon]
MQNTNDVIVSVRNLTKTFPGGVVALDNVSLDIHAGEILALLGENGSGKSTFVKILAGIYIPDAGEVWVKTNGKLAKVDISDPVEALRYGIALVSQVPQLVDKLTVAENLAVTLATLKWRGSHSFKSIYRVSRLIREEGERFGFKIDPNERVFNLSYSQKQMVEIFRALLLGAKVLLLDEVLTYLPAAEKRRFYDILLKFRAEGGAVVLITHKLSEAFELSDRIAVIRSGRIVGVVKTKDTTLQDVRSMMFDATTRHLARERVSTNSGPGKEEIVVKDLHVKDDFGREVVKGVNMVVRRGEIVGVAGVAGNGQKELIETIVGLRKPVKGCVEVAGVDATRRGIKYVRSLGVCFIPDRPLEYGCSLDHSILENVAITFSLGSGFLMNWDRLRELARKMISEYQVVTPGENTSLKVLSGGNIMKVIVGKEIDSASRAIIACNPTRGLDEAAASFVRQKIRSRVEKDELAVLIASEDLDELLTISDRIYVANSGKLYGPFDPRFTPREEIEEYMVM